MRLILSLLASLALVPASAQNMEIPVETQIALFVKVSAFDRRAESTSADFVVAVAFQSGSRQSTTAKDAIAKTLADTPPVDGKPVRLVTIDLDKSDLRNALREANARMLYVTPVRGISIGDIASVARAAKVTTYTGVPKYVDQGLSVGVRLVGDRPKLLVNLRVARLEGADFSAEFLKLAQVVQ